MLISIEHFIVYCIWAQQRQAKNQCEYSVKRIRSVA